MISFLKLLILLGILIYFPFLLKNTLYAQNGASIPLPNNYTLEDLKVLHNQGDFKEYLKFAKTIRPVQRNALWNKMTFEMTLAYLQSMAKSPENLTELGLQEIEGIASWPTNANNSAIKEKLLELQYFYLSKKMPEAISVSDGDFTILLERIKSFSLQKTIPTTLAYQFAKNIETFNPGSESRIEAIKGLFSSQENWMLLLLSHLFLSPSSDIYCKDPLPWKYGWISLKKFALDLKRQDQEQFDLKLKTRMNWSCWLSLRPNVLNIILNKNLELQSDPTNKVVAFHLLSMDKTLPPETQSLVQVLYLLNNPVKSDLFNQAYENLNQLAFNPEMRAQVLNLLKEIDPLPDDLFIIEDVGKFEDVLKQINIKFPEYIHLYLKTCGDYLSGTPFLRGNPTVNCLPLCKRLTHNKSTITGLKEFIRVKTLFKDKCL